MNRKSYFLGLGVGITVTALILIISGHMKKGMSDEEVIARAKELGMVESSTLTDPIGNSLNKDFYDKEESDKEDGSVTQNNDSSDNENKEVSDNIDNSNPDGNKEIVTDNKDTNVTDNTQKTEDKNVTDNSTQDKKDDSVTDNKTEDKKDDSVTDNKSEDKKDDKTSNKENSETEKFVIVTIRGGMGSEEAASQAKNAGLVEDDIDFNKYLCANGYDKRLNVGDHEIPEGADYETIAKKLCGIE